MCVGFFMALFAGLFQASVNSTGDQDVIGVYWAIIKTLGCILLACSANVLKTLFAKLLSSHFYRDSYFEKMQDALCKVSLASAASRLFRDLATTRQVFCTALSTTSVCMLIT